MHALDTAGTATIEANAIRAVTARIIALSVYAQGPTLCGPANLRGTGPRPLSYLLSSPVLGNCAQAILQQKVDPRVQGRVFSLALFLTQWSVPLAQFAAGPLADKVFEPWLSVHGL